LVKFSIPRIDEYPDYGPLSSPDFITIEAMLSVVNVREVQWLRAFTR
jgi:hypothetical protein